MKRTVLLVLLVFIGGLLFADGMGGYDGDVIGRWRWESAKLAMRTIETGDVSGKYTWQFFDDGSMKIRIDCQNGEGTYTADGSVLTMNMVKLTNTACGDEALNEAFIQLINEVGSFSYHFKSDNELVLEFAGGSGQAVFLRTNTND